MSINFENVKKSLAGAKAKRILFTLLALVILGAILYFGRSLLVAAWVNGRPVLRLSVVKELEAQGGKNILESLIDRSLIFQEASKNKVNISDKDVNSEISRIEESLKKQGVSLNDALAMRGQSRTTLFQQIRLQKTVEALLGGKIKIADSELKVYFDENSKLFDKSATFESVKSQIRDQIFNQKLTEEYKKWIADLRAKAKVLYFVNF